MHQKALPRVSLAEDQALRDATMALLVEPQRYGGIDRGGGRLFAGLTDAALQVLGELTPWRTPEHKKKRRADGMVNSLVVVDVVLTARGLFEAALGSHSASVQPPVSSPQHSRPPCMHASSRGPADRAQHQLQHQQLCRSLVASAYACEHALAAPQLSPFLCRIPAVSLQARLDLAPLEPRV
ncbi:uncharacterized protein K460DRAFT_164378 [Cucurbitaria berberidis CBS 394.84]|uniref:Uncharacterized protein n=1 Tax=Cucurbitaria berberidis CBS 394.84 TaxID=1168544 RepID=A0A9P4GFT9_9PLEO|nr:uncharacterized protein K460DRAFT_164378 [Cucurbitaria berberidis CBS 394.84]KAF1844449.1 hypothetical protein K460DRAFT_164378 [Cucurbitaria berberidis CBS 394.84]